MTHPHVADVLDCADFLRLAHDLVDADAATWSAAVREHLTACPPCEIYLDQLLDLRTALRATISPLDPRDPRVARTLHTLTTHQEDRS